MKIKKDLLEKYAQYKTKNSQDEYSKACVDAGEIFGEAIDNGKTFDEANKIMCDAEKGLTGYMAGALMMGLVHFHERGDEIKVWWNKRMGSNGKRKLFTCQCL